MRLICCFLLLSYSVQSQAQRNTYLGVERGLCSTRFQFVDNTSIVRYHHWEGGTINGLIRQELSKHFSVETGFTYHYNSEHIGKSKEVYSIAGYYETYQIPLKLSVHTSILKNRIFCFGSIGAIFCFEEPTNYGGGRNTIYFSSGDSMTTSFNTTNVTDFYPLYSGSFGVRIRIVDELLLTLSSGYSIGFKPVRESEVSYLDDSGDIKIVDTISKGDYLFVNWRLSYPINRAWKLLKKLHKNVSDKHVEIV